MSWKVFISPHLTDDSENELSWKGQRIHVSQPLIIGAMVTGRYSIANATEAYLATATAANTTVGMIRAYSFYVDADLKLDELMINQVNGAGAGAFFRFGLYDATVAGLPSNLIVSSNQLEGISGSTDYRLLPVDFVLRRGIYFLAISTVRQMSFRGIPQANMRITHGFANGNQTTPVSRFEAPFVFGVLPSVFPSPLTQTNGAGHNPIAIFTKLSPP